MRVMEALLKKKLDVFKREFPSIFRSKTDADCDWLPAFYLRAFYFKDGFSVRAAKDALCGEAYDGGFDAVFANPDRSENEVVIVQSKCYEHAIRVDGLEAELRKIGTSLKQFQRGGMSKRAESVKEAYSRAVSECEDSHSVRYAIDIVTSWMPTSDRQRAVLDAVAAEYLEKLKRLNVSRISLIYGDQLLDQAESWNEEKALVDHDVFRWYKKDGVLRYQGSVIVNLRASSLREVYRRRQKEVLGLNLRYHVKRNTMQKDVDSKIENTIRNCADKFWFLNNGIMIICRDVRLNRGGSLDLFDYSIVNGGQTTYNINDHWLDCSVDDFAVTCKIVCLPDIKKSIGMKFAQNIAVSANSQKPINEASLIANNREQVRLGSALADHNICYIRKEGDKPGFKEYKYRANIEDIGKLGLAGILMMPMEARNKTKLMFADPYYERIFRKERARMFRDLLVIRDAYIAFRKEVGNRKKKPSWCRDHDEWRIASYGLTFVISSLVFCIRTIERDIAWGDLKGMGEEPKKYAKVASDQMQVDRFLSDDIAEGVCPYDFNPIFRKLISIMYDAYQNSASDNDGEEMFDAFLKRREVFLKYIAPMLRKACGEERFRSTIAMLMR